MWINGRQVSSLLFIAAVPAVLGSPLGVWIPGPLRLLLALLWVAAPMGDFILRKGDSTIPSTIRWPMACLLGWC
ncbi:MAG TPA: hypothetical protein PK395_16595, partial [bacterium]|nr:hypothetical protein [bacterium]